MKVAVCLPTGDLMHARTAFALLHAQNFLLRQRRDIYCNFIHEQTTIIEINRHRAVIVALGLQADYILFIDSDMVFSPDMISRLVDADKDIIGLNAVMRCDPFTPCARDLQGKPVRYDKNGIQEIHSIGTGVLLIKAEVFRKIGMPYFQIIYDQESSQWLGEDFNFCQRARAAGYKIYVHNDLSRQCFHLGTKAFGYKTGA